jgi:hypothetical protein
MTAMKDGDLEQRKLDELKREFRYWWGNLSRDQMLEFAHKRDELLLLLNEKYGYARQEAEAEVEEALRALDTSAASKDYSIGRK